MIDFQTSLPPALETLSPPDRIQLFDRVSPFPQQRRPLLEAFIRSTPNSDLLHYLTTLPEGAYTRHINNLLNIVLEGIKVFAKACITESMSQTTKTTGFMPADEDVYRNRDLKRCVITGKAFPFCIERAYLVPPRLSVDHPRYVMFWAFWALMNEFLGPTNSKWLSDHLIACGGSYRVTCLNMISVERACIFCLLRDISRFVTDRR
jgi:hypothetical protein